MFGHPKEMLSDQGKEFLNATVRELTQIAGIEHRVTSPYHPKTNGLTEKFNGTLVSSLRKHVENDPVTWPHWIPYVLLAYRSRINSITGFTPFQLMFGRSVNTFEDFSFVQVKL